MEYIVIVLLLVVSNLYLLVRLRTNQRRISHLNNVLERARNGYKRWIGSYAWKVVAELSKRRDKYTCRLCGRKRPHVQLQSHHPQNYDQVLYDEKPEDLTTLCAECHEAVTRILRLRRRGVSLLDALEPQYRE